MNKCHCYWNGFFLFFFLFFTFVNLLNNMYEKYIWLCDVVAYTSHETNKQTKFYNEPNGILAWCLCLHQSNWSVKAIRTRRRSFMSFKAAYMVLWTIRTWDSTWRHSWGKHYQYIFSTRSFSFFLSCIFPQDHWEYSA